jgi:ubiquinone/menaquinone biosynthesis C-methylase UbiE
MPDFSIRSNQTEIMDDLTHDHATIDRVLDELDVINNLLGGYSVTYDALKKINLQDNVRISDWGCGGGDGLRKIAEWAKKKNINVELIGIDAAENIVDYAKRKCAVYTNIHFIVSDVFDDRIKENQFDIVVSSLFTHHFDDESWVRLIRKMHYASSKAVIINDLHRHWFAYYSIKILTKLFSKSPMVQNDGPVSVLRAFKKRDLVQLLEKAGVKNYTIKWMWAFRWQVIIIC